MQKYLKESIFQILSEIAFENNKRAFLIGGFVRDLLLKRPTNDIDVVVEGDGIAFAEKVAEKLPGKNKVAIYKRYGTAMLRSGDKELEFVGARKESYTPDSRNPSVKKGTLKDDQNRRDFTINAMALSLNKNDFGQLIDPFFGVKDLKNRVIRTPLEAGKTFSDDPLRMLRGIRFATQLDFDIHPDTFEGIKTNAERIKIISKERITIELNKIMAAQKPSLGFRYLYAAGILPLVFPEIHNLKGVDVRQGIDHKDNFCHTIQVTDNVAEVSDNIWLRWAALLHDVAKPATKRFTGNAWTFHGHEFLGYKMIPGIFRRMRLPLGQPMEYVRKLVRLHLRPIALVSETITESAVRRLLFEAGDDIDDLMTLCEADITSKNDRKVELFKKNFKLLRQRLKQVEENDRLRNWQPPVSGEEIMETFGINPSKTVGIIKDAIREAILDGEINNDKKEAFRFMLKKGKELGLEPKR